MKKTRLIALIMLLACLLAGCGGSAQNEELQSASPASELLAGTEQILSYEDYYNLGVRYLSDGNYEEAIIAFLAAIEIEPRRFEAQYELGRSYRAYGQPENAIDPLLIAVEVEEETHDASYELAYTYINLTMFQEAEEIAVPLWNDGDYDAGMILVICYAAQERFDEMQALLEDEMLYAKFEELYAEEDMLYFDPRNQNGEKEGHGVGIYGSYIYVGNYTADVRSGQGSWRDLGNGSWHFIGEWANDAPNGYGERIRVNSPPAVKEEGRTYALRTVMTGNLANWAFDGDITNTWDMDSGETHIWLYALDNGYAAEGVIAYCSECGADLTAGSSQAAIEH